MEKIKISEQELVDAVCIYVANKKQIQPTEVMVELMWDEELGFSAEVETFQRQQILIEANLIEALRYWLQMKLNRNPYSAAIELVLDDEEGIVAFATYHS